ncbi:cinnamoyl-CoA reductase [Trifolium repens]|nr:cinnamoyl-CoA reductase [Trifolium repens]
MHETNNLVKNQKRFQRNAAVAAAAGDTSPDSVIFTLESNLSLVSSASASVDRCSFTSDAHDHDSLNSELSPSWYCYAKTEAEEQALNFTERTGLDVVSICRTLVLGPILQSTTNASSLFLINLLKGCDTLENEHCQINRIVDVRDVADAILLAYENHEAERRYICTSHAIKDRDFFPVSSSILSWMITICVFLFYMQFAC